MINKTYIIIGSVVIALVLVVLLVFVYISRNSKTGEEISIPSRDGESINVNDFKSSAALKDNQAFILRDDPDIAVYLYNETSGVFNILIHASEEKEFNQKRIFAEGSFIEQLGITEQEACQLNVEVSTDGPENDLQSFSKIQGLSFCN